jgi:transcriptional regulator with XRE-family HTH domain
MDTAALIKRARENAWLSQNELALRAGVNRSSLSRYERGTLVPSIATLTRILACAGQQLRVDLEPLDAEIRRAANAIAAEPPDDRPGVKDWSRLLGIDDVPHRVEGMAAASILGAPVAVPTFELALADDPKAFEWLAHTMQHFRAAIRAPAWPAFETVRRPAEELRELISDECPAGEFAFTLLRFLGTVRIRRPEDVARHVRVSTTYGLVPVQPIHEVESTDPESARVLRVLREMQQSAGDEQPDGADQTDQTGRPPRQTAAICGTPGR